MYDLTYKSHSRDSDFFCSSIKFKQFTDDIQKSKMTQIIDVQIQCLGYGHFNKQKVLSNFFSYIRGIITYCKHIKTLKISFQGFDLPQQKIIPKICLDIIKNSKQNIKTLWFHTGNLTNCTIQDFQSILSLSTELSHVNFQQISLQFSRWVFLKAQPNINQLEDSLKKVLKNAELTKINNQKIRLEISSWYYDYCAAKSFLKFICSQNDILKNFCCKNSEELQRKKAENKQIARKVLNFENGQQYQQTNLPIRVQQFHKKIQNFIRNLLQMMNHVRQFQIDFRNWNELLKMKNLQKKLNNITKKDTYQKSIVSKRIGLEERQNQTQLRMVFVM